MRFTAIELAPGWTKFTVCPLPMSKFCQLSDSIWLFCWMVVTLPDCWIWPEPEITCPPPGALAAWASPVVPSATESRDNIRTRGPIAWRRAPPSLLLASSDAGTQALSVRFQHRR